MTTPKHPSLGAQWMLFVCEEAAMSHSQGLKGKEERPEPSSKAKVSQANLHLCMCNKPPARISPPQPLAR